MEEHCTLLGLSSPNHNIKITVPVLLEEQLVVFTTTKNAKDIYKLAPVVATNINYPTSPDTDPDLVEQMRLG